MPLAAGGADRAEQCAVRDVGGRDAVGYSRGFASVVPLMMARPQLRYYQGERGMSWPGDKPRPASSILDFSGVEEQFFEPGRGGATYEDYRRRGDAAPSGRLPWSPSRNVTSQSRALDHMAFSDTAKLAVKTRRRSPTSTAKEAPSIIGHPFPVAGETIWTLRGSHRRTFDQGLRGREEGGDDVSSAPCCRPVRMGWRSRSLDEARA